MSNALDIMREKAWPTISWQHVCVWRKGQEIQHVRCIMIRDDKFCNSCLSEVYALNMYHVANVLLILVKLTFENRVTKSKNLNLNLTACLRNV